MLNAHVERGSAGSVINVARAANPSCNGSGAHHAVVDEHRVAARPHAEPLLDQVQVHPDGLTVT